MKAMSQKRKSIYRGKGRRERKSASQRGQDSLSEKPKDYGNWKHPGGKLLIQGPESLTDAELLAILLGTGTKGKPAEVLATEILSKYSTLREAIPHLVSNGDGFKGVGKVKQVRLSAAMEMARRLFRKDLLASPMLTKEKSYLRLPSIASLLFPEEYVLLPDTTELFEVEFAYYEYNLLSKEEILKRGGFFKSIAGKPTNHYLICLNNSPLIREGRSEITRLYFQEGNFSTGYATHGLFPYRGKFHPQLIKGILNLLKVQPGEIVLDTMCGSGTLNVE